MQDESLPGAQLRRAREEKGISREEVSRGLHLSRNYLIALENDEYGKLPEPAFIKGYLRNYARLLGLPGEEVAALYQQRLDRERVSAEEHQAESEERRRVASPRWRLPALIVLVIILALLVAWWLWPGHQAGSLMSGDGHQSESGRIENSQSESPPPGASTDGVGASAAAMSQDASEGTAENAEENTPASDSALPSAGGGEATGQGGAAAAGTGSDSSSGVTDEGAGADNGPTGTSAAANSNGAAVAGESAAAGDESSAQSAATAPAATGTASTGQSAPAAASGSLAMAFSRVCWVKVVDGSGKTLAVGTQQAGTAMDLQGEAPFRVTIGDAGAVSSVVVNGKQTSLPSQQSGEVIHVTLP